MTSAFSVFSPQQWRVLQALAVYRFLTVDQMLRLGISRNARSLRDKSLFALRYHNCIHSENIGSFLPDVHHLTPHGCQLLSELEDAEVGPAPSNKRQPFSALFARHRFAQVDFQIGLHQWAAARGDAEVLLELQDFVRRPKAATELKVPTLSKAIVPDGTFVVGANSGTVAIYLMEVHRTTQSKAVAAQLTQYFEVIKTQAVKQRYGYQANPVICSIHHDPAVLTSVKRRLSAQPGFEPFRHNIVFRSMDTLTKDFTGGWHFADDKPAQPFPMPSPLIHAICG